ncbi:MAG: polysaccharide lyase [Rubrivivax sp.]|nr:polysaccharide lyase [Rubrivivax sp.]
MKPTRLQALGAFFPADQTLLDRHGQPVYQPRGDWLRRTGGDFTLREDDPDTFDGGRKRCELTWAPWRSAGPWSFSARVQCDPYIGPDEKTPHPDKVCLFQVHAAGAQSNRGLHPALMLQHSAGRFTLRIHYATAEDAESTGCDIWSDRNDGEPHRWAVTFSYGADGFLRAKRDGKQVVDYRGPLGFAPYPAGYFKCGIYRWPSGNPKPWNFSPVKALVDRVVMRD